MQSDDFFITDDLPDVSPSKRVHVSSYREKSLKLQNPNFHSLLDLSVQRLRSMKLSDSQDRLLFESLNRGTGILENEEQLDKYMQAYGRKHYVKFNTLFKSVPIKIFDGYCDLVDCPIFPLFPKIGMDFLCSLKGRTFRKRMPVMWRG